MIIRTEITPHAAHRPQAPDRPAATRVPKINREPDAPPRQTITRRMEMERSLGDALSIAQMSQNLIHRVLNISLRLKNISSGAITTGKINAQELSEALVSIKSALGDYGEPITNPLQSYAPASSRMPELPDISGDVKIFRNIAAEMKNGEYGQNDRIDVLAAGLNRKLEQFNAAESAIAGLMKNTSASSTVQSEHDARELMARVRSAMESNPGAALHLQGNIRHGAAGNIFS